MASKVQALHVDDTEIITPVVGSRAFRSTAVDGVGITLASGALALQTAGASRANGVQRDELSKYVPFAIQGALNANDAAAGIFSEENTYGTALTVLDVIVKIATASTGACTIDIGEAATESSSDDLIDGLSIAATGVFSSSMDSGTNGRRMQRWGSGGFVTGSMASGGTAGLVGTYLIIAVDME